MKNYLHWVLRQFYLILFWPSKFAKEIEGRGPDQPKLSFAKRLTYLLKMLPWMLVLSVLGNLVAGLLIRKVAIEEYQWPYSLLGLAFGTLSGFTFGVLFGILAGVVFGVMSGIFFGVVSGAVVDGTVGVIIGVIFGVALGIKFDGKHDFADSVFSGVGFGVIYSIVAGVDFGVMFGIVFPISFCLTYFRLGSYPLDAFLSWLANMKAQADPASAFRWWRRCPVAWNEVIYLPLPGAGKLLALAVRQNREEGFKQITFVAAERPLQRRVALEALTEVALGDLEAKTAAELSMTPDRTSWAAAAPLALPDEFVKAIPDFDRIAYHLAQSMSSSSAYRKADVLNSAVEEIETLQKSLVISKGKLAPRLLQVANHWREITESEQVRLRQLASERRETPNPFIFGNPVDERNAGVFAGRKDIIRKIEESILGSRQSPTIVLHGPRRVGKSSILKQLPRLLGPDFTPAMLDCQNPAVGGSEASMAGLLRHLSASLSEGLHRRRVEIEPLADEELVREPYSAFDRWLERAEKAMPPKMRALLCLDEYEKLQRSLDAGWGGEFLDGLRHILQHRTQFVLIFTGTHTFAELGPAWTDRFISARRVRVSFLTAEEVRPLLTRPIPEFNLTYAPGALDAIIETTQGQPFLTQAVAFELVQYLNEQQRKEVKPIDVETAVTRALESGGEFFANVWNDAGEHGQAILCALVNSRTPPDFPDALKWLREHDVLNEKGKFAVPMMERWVRENGD